MPSELLLVQSQRVNNKIKKKKEKKKERKVLFDFYKVLT